MKKDHRPQFLAAANGFTLVEVLVAAAVLAIGLLSVATMTSQSTIQDSRAFHMTHASMMVEEFLENATRMQYDPDDYGDLNGTLATRTVNGVVYTMNCTLSALAPVDRCREMTCTVIWNNKGIPTSTQYVYTFSPKY